MITNSSHPSAIQPVSVVRDDHHVGAYEFITIGDDCRGECMLHVIEFFRVVFTLSHGNPLHFKYNIRNEQKKKKSFTLY